MKRLLTVIIEVIYEDVKSLILPPRYNHLILNLMNVKFVASVIFFEAGFKTKNRPSASEIITPSKFTPLSKDWFTRYDSYSAWLLVR